MNRLHWFVPALDDPDLESGSGAFAFERQIVGEHEANAVSSLCDGLPETHMPVIDFDVPASLVPSSTPGHSHLYIDVPMTWPQFERVLAALAAAGVVETGYLAACRARESSFVRKPGVLKKKVDS